jgi:hypothetical protein
MRTVVQLMPRVIRRRLLEENVIQQAIAIGSDQQMKKLMIIWKQYYEPTLEVACNLCYSRVLKNFKAMLDTMVLMEKEDGILDA